MRVFLSSSIRIRRDDLPSHVRAAIETQLTIHDPEKSLAQREMLWGADRMDDHIRLYRYDDDGYMVLPMGFRHALLAGLTHYGIVPEIEDWRHRGLTTLLQGRPPIELRDYQESMCQALLDGQCGVVEAPTAAGKTRVVLEAIRRSGRDALVIVEKASLARQWMAATRDLLGVEAGYIGEGESRMGSITIVLRQAIYARAELLEYWFFEREWGTVVLDEAHHAASAWTLIDIMQRFTSLNRWGVTATPDRDPDYFPILQAVVGPVLWETTMEDAAEHLVIPRVRVLESDFEFDFHPTHQAINERGNRVVVRNNYGDLLSELCSDHDRNLLIAHEAVREADAGHHVLIVSKRKRHLEEIDGLLGSDAEIPRLMLTGSDKGSRATEIREIIEHAHLGSILLSTVAEEGLDIPRLDRVISAYPLRNVETMRQIVGRVMRPYPGKTDAVVIDVRDGRQDLLRSQFLGRAQQLYNKEHWVVERGVIHSTTSTTKEVVDG